MTETNQKQLGNTLWKIADDLRGAMNADDFRDYMLSFLFLRYLSDNYETAAKKELGKDYPKNGVTPGTPDGSRRTASMDRGRKVRLSRTPLPPNRTGGFPAYGFPVSSVPEGIVRNDCGPLAD